MEFADKHPSAKVLGVDLSPIQPASVPPNCSFRVDNVEEDWIPEEKFDYIHSRAMVAGIKDWKRFFEQSFEYVDYFPLFKKQALCE
jgi:trans-aconitate methyltransferase